MFKLCFNSCDCSYSSMFSLCVCFLNYEMNKHLDQESAKQDKSAAAKLKEAWPKVRPATNKFPCRTEAPFQDEELPVLTPGEQALIAFYHPVVTVTKSSINDKKYKEESISLFQNTQDTWSRYLPRTHLKNRFMIVERSFKDLSKRYCKREISILFIK